MNILEIIALPELASIRGYDSAQFEGIRTHLLAARTALLADDPASFNTASQKLADQLAEASKTSHLYPPAVWSRLNSTTTSSSRSFGRSSSAAWRW